MKNGGRRKNKKEITACTGRKCKISTLDKKNKQTFIKLDYRKSIYSIVDVHVCVCAPSTLPLCHHHSTKSLTQANLSWNLFKFIVFEVDEMSVHPIPTS